jgi:hypothetical protein
MTFHVPPPVRQAVGSTAIIVGAMRCWRKARDAGHLALPYLFRILEEPDFALLAPALDSLIHFYEAALGRLIETGDGRLSEDEQLLLALVDGAQSGASIARSQESAHVLDCALCSTRIMLARTRGFSVMPLPPTA